MRRASIQSSVIPKGYTGKHFNKWINYIYKLVQSK